MTRAIEHNPRQLLSQLAQSNSSGCLKLEEGLISWQIYLYQGNLQYVDCSIQLLDQLRYYLHLFGWKQAVIALKELPQSCLKIQSCLEENYANQDLYNKILSWLLTKKHLTRSQGSELVEYIAKDELQFCIWLKRSISTWQDGDYLPLWIKNQVPQIRALDLAELLQIQKTRLEKWQNCSSSLLSIYQRPYFAPGWEKDNFYNPGSLNLKTLKELTQVLRGRTSIRQLSLLLNKDELYVAQILSPYIEKKIIYLHHPRSPLDKIPTIPKNAKILEQLSSKSLVNNHKNQFKNPEETTVKVWNIVCIDDSPTILQEMQRFLAQDKFNVTTIDDPVQAVSKIFQINPDLILLDITMPRINGYKLCDLLRSSGKCDQTPIIMVTGNTGLIDKVRAKLAGATDYLTKPFAQQGLRDMVAKYLQ
jgi:two-component system, chemotaxis family, response regulator PixG